MRPSMTCFSPSPLLLACLFTLSGFPVIASAQNTPKSNSITTSATVAPNCSIRVENFSFGEWDPFVSSYLSHSIYVLCNNHTPYTIYGDDRVGEDLYLSNADNSEKIVFSVMTQTQGANNYRGGTAPFSSPTNTGGAGNIASISGIGEGVEKAHPLYFRIASKDYSGYVRLVSAGNYSTVYNLRLVY